MGLALALSSAMHIGAGLLFIVAGSFNIGGEKISTFIIEDIALPPSISAPPKPMIAPNPEALSESSSPTEQEPEKTAQMPAPEQPPASTGSSANDAGFMSTQLGLGMTHGFFSSLADGRSLRDEIRGYYFEMVEKINREWWDKAGLLKESLHQDGIFELLVQRDGTIVSIRMTQGTGSSEADRLLMQIINSASPFTPLPPTYDLSLFRAPLRIKAPSFLFRLGN
ncbi:MAG: TonB C-terminal domain-containing protein [Desulfuromonadales bacterium]